MSSVQILLAVEILREYYGDVTAEVGRYLMQIGNAPLKLVAQQTKTKLQQVKKSLCVLIQHNLVRFDVNKRGFVEYSVNLADILVCSRFPNYIYCAKTLYGDPGELVIEELLQKGQMQTDTLIERVYERLQENGNEGAKISLSVTMERFSSLVKTHFLQRCPYPISNSSDSLVAPALSITPEELFSLPHIDLKAIQHHYNHHRGVENGSADQPPSKKRKLESRDSDILWRVNIGRFHQHFRDQALIAAASSKLNKKAGEVFRSMLRICEIHSSCNDIAAVSPPITSTEIFHTLPKELGIKREMLDQYLVLLADDSCPFIMKIGDSGGGTFAINFQSCIRKITEAHVESVILERFGSKCLRIFRLLLAKKHLEQKQVEDIVMIPAKEAKEMLYHMFGEQFVDLTEVPKTPDHAPSRTFYLFSIDLDKVSRKVLQMSYKALYNLMIRRTHETKEHRRVLEKQQRVEAIAASLEQSGVDEAQRSEIEEMINPAERQQLNKVKNMTLKLEQSELEIDNTIFMLELYLQYSKLKPLM